MKYALLFAIVGVIGLWGMGVMHEQVHVEIFRGYGINSHVEYLSHFPHFVTIAEKGCPTEECKLAHNINEAFSYPLMSFYIILVFGMFMIILILEDRL